MRSPAVRESSSSAPPPDGEPASRISAPLHAAPRWAAELGPTGALIAALIIVLLDFALAIRLWASVPLTVIETVLAIPWIRLVLRTEISNQKKKSLLARARALVAHFLNIGLFGLVLFEKWRLLVQAIWAESPDAFVPGYRSFAVVAFVVATIGVLVRGHRAQRVLSEAADHPARLMVLSFGIAAFLGGFLLSLPVAVSDVRHASFIDGLFTAISAVCVTGLVVNDVAATYSFFGEIVIAVLAQIGGLGIMVLSASFVVLAGRSLRVKQSAVLAQMIDASSLATLRRTLVKIVGYALFFELCGAGLLYLLSGFHPEIAHGASDPHPLAGAGDRAWWAIFHAISAFCNAGFSLSHGSLSGLGASWPMCLTFSMLIVIGGMGFPVIDELRRRLWARIRRQRPERLSLHARVALTTSAALVLAAAVPILLLEWGNTMAHMPWHARLLAAVFQSVSMRTAGFNTIDFGGMHAATLTLACVVMFIGASPGSTGGGIKTTTFAAIFAEFRAELEGHGSARLFDRRLADGVVRRAMGVTFLSLAIVSLLTFVLLLTDQQEPLATFFEVVSAFSTCGLSTGITPRLSSAGKIVIMVAMFVGRIGPLTVALAMASEARRSPVQLASERVMIG